MKVTSQHQVPAVLFSGKGFSLNIKVDVAPETVWTLLVAKITQGLVRFRPVSDIELRARYYMRMFLLLTF